MKKSYKNSLSLLLLFTLLFPFLPAQAEEGDFWLTPNINKLNPGQSFDVEVHASTGAENIGAFSLSLAFDQSLMAVDTGVGNNGFSTGTDTGTYTVLSNTDDLVLGQYKIGGICVQNCANGNDIHLLTFHLKTLAAFSTGLSTLKIVVTELSNTNGTAVSLGNISSAQIITIVQDKTAPLRTSLLPIGTLAAGTSQATISVMTIEKATCKYGTTAGASYASLSKTLTSSSGFYHSANITGLVAGNSYNYYVRCVDETANVNTTDAKISFSVASASTSGGGSSLPGFTSNLVGAGAGWEHGTDEEWHLKLNGAKTEFKMGEKVQFFAQVGPISVDHQWSLRLYKNEILDREVVNPVFSPDKTFGWNFSNFVPYELNLAAGNYRAEYWLETGGVKNEVGRASFNVSLPDEIYIFDHAATSLWWENGVGDEYWNLKPLGETNLFSVGDTVHSMVQLRDVYKKHRYKTELYRGTTMLWDYEADWLDVGAGWAYSNFYPYYEKAQPGNYNFKTYLDTGTGYKLLATSNFTVAGELADYEHTHSYAAKGWAYGVGEEYWNLVPTGISDEFVAGDTVYAVSQIKNVYVDHQWKVELYKSGAKLWAYEAPKNVVGSGWSYSNFTPTYSNSIPGEFEFKIYLASGGDYKLFDSLKFRVTQNTANYRYLGLTIAKNWKYGVEADYYNLVPVGVSRVYAKGDTVYAISKLKEVSVNHKWKVELYKYGQLQWANETELLNVGAGWAYDVYKPFLENAEIGNYEFKIYLDSGSGYKFLDSDTFSVK